MSIETYTVENFREGMRIELHPASDHWMRGDRFATIDNVGRSFVRVTFQRSGRSGIRLAMREVGAIIEEV